MMKKVMKGIFLTLMFILNKLHNDLRFLPERMKIINFDIWLVDSFFDKKEYLIHIRNLKQALNHRLDLKKVHRIIKFNQKAWLKLRINMDTELRKKTKNDFGNNFLKLMNNTVFGKSYKKQRYQICYNRAKKELFSIRTKLSCNKLFKKRLLIIEMRKTQILINWAVYLNVLILELSKILMYVFWYDFVKPKYMVKRQNCIVWIQKVSLPP